MQKWEYAYVSFYYNSVCDTAIGDTNAPGIADRMTQASVLEQLGEQGWEMTGVAGSDMAKSYKVFFKRPKA